MGEKDSNFKPNRGTSHTLGACDGAAEGGCEKLDNWSSTRYGPDPDPDH